MGKDKRLLYNDSGRMTGMIQNYQISILHDGRRHFKAVVNGKHYDSLSQEFVEKELGIQVHVKHTGSEIGYPSESVPRAVWRYLVDRHNDFDSKVLYEPS